MSERILLVDDDPDFRQEFKECFEEYGIREAADGEEALSILRKPHEISVVVLDIKMPGEDGIGILKKIKKADPNLAIVMLTGYSSKDVAIEALKAHADDYIEKPIDIDRTKEILDRLLLFKHGKGDPDAPDDIKAKIERVKRFVEINCYKKISLTDAAQTIYLSPKYVSRIFKKYAGVDFSEYKLKLKIEKAKELLTIAGYNVNQTSDKLGYENPESLIREFKKLVGCTPAKYRRKNSGFAMSGKRKAVAKQKSRTRKNGRRAKSHQSKRKNNHV